MRTIVVGLIRAWLALPHSIKIVHKARRVRIDIIWRLNLGDDLWWGASKN